MTYSRQLPPVRELLRLAQTITFPKNASEIVVLAQIRKSPNTVIDFIKSFPDDELFTSRADFMLRTEELEMIIEQERLAPAERLHNPLD